jgi:tRNA-Thr(GGU) m(6)t(6)A37 methyltransferase TsaA
MEFNFQIIGFVQNDWNEAEPAQAYEIMQSVSTIKIKEEFADALYKIEDSKELNIIWNFNRSEGFKLQTTTRSGNFKGVFATRSPHRPSAIGLSRVKLIERKGNILKVTGLDALNGTPVLDIKPFVTPEEFAYNYKNYNPKT